MSAILLVGGCVLGPRAYRAYPEACRERGFSELRCKAIVAQAAELAHVRPDQVANARFVDAPPKVSLGGRLVATVTLTLAGGAERTQEVWCTGVGRDDDRVCRDDPRIGVGGGVDMDVPCSGEPPAACAALPPEPRVASVAAAHPLEVAVLDVPLEHIGRYDIEVGVASLPDGYLSDRRLTLADSQPTDFWIEDGVRLLVRSVERPWLQVGSRYREPFDGVEHVDVSLAFRVTEVSPGAVLRVRDIVVR